MKRWQTVGDLLDRMDVPGGWVYRTTDASTGSPSMVFVPNASPPDYRRVLEALQNMSGAFDTPVERRRRPFDAFQEEAVKSMREALGGEI